MRVELTLPDGELSRRCLVEGSEITAEGVTQLFADAMLGLGFHHRSVREALEQVADEMRGGEDACSDD